MVGQNIAAGEFKRVKKILLNLAIITVSIAIVFSLLICFFPEQIFGLFVTDDESAASVALLARGFVPIAVLLFFGSASRAIMNALLNGSGNYRMNFAVAILDGIIMRVGLALLFGLVLDMKHYGFWLGDAVAGFTPFFIGLGFYWSGSWKKGKAVAEETEN
jgi:Na+-driven multidrug efflux pump